MNDCVLIEKRMLEADRHFVRTLYILVTLLYCKAHFKRITVFACIVVLYRMCVLIRLFCNIQLVQ